MRSRKSTAMLYPTWRMPPPAMRFVVGERTSNGTGCRYVPSVAGPGSDRGSLGSKSQPGLPARPPAPVGRRPPQTSTREKERGWGYQIGWRGCKIKSPRLVVILDRVITSASSRSREPSIPNTSSLVSRTSITVAMDQVKPKQAQPQKPTTKPLSMVETYQRQWDQLMEDTNKQIDKIRQEEQARNSKQSTR
ncbi:uncharacterized protein N7498_006731 [Penicillium cinerascens]|uniref:Uncharacterized protein n=1 Tax=Penicillium cinerascens TaxID=70096 RepID=A0A9W9SXN1_9EURO|nr:uncharacterized protein N7498_006731 [Penicillium cinerascens]KAJ5202068.1 hypothetical protein N7498_006731 [Penicillium cinerascens]